MSQSKIVEAVALALNYIENSLNAVSKKDERNLTINVWRASAELEYALFLFSILHSDESKPFSPKTADPKLKQIEVEGGIKAVKDMLIEAKNGITTGAVNKPREKLLTAKNYLLKIQEILEKKRKGKK